MTFKIEKRQESIDISEAYNIWDILTSKYLAVERLETYEKLIHDLDFKAVIKRTIKTLKENVSILEGFATRFAIKTPDRNRSYSTFSGGQQIISDEFMAQDLLLYYQEHIENLSKALRSTTTNDSVRGALIKMTLKTLDETDTLIKYLTSKGWIYSPPLYKHVPPDNNQTLSLSEAFNLWDHLTLRYDNIRTTQYYITSTHDLDFKSLLSLGLKFLKRQTTKLEKEHEHYGIPLPKRPSSVTLTLTNTEILEDDYMYRVLINAFQGAAILHGQAFKACALCDRLRNLFKQFFIDELDITDKFIKYGKMKGWLNLVPTYGP